MSEPGNVAHNRAVPMTPDKSVWYEVVDLSNGLLYMSPDCAPEIVQSVIGYATIAPQRLELMGSGTTSDVYNDNGRALKISRYREEGVSGLAALRARVCLATGLERIDPVVTHQYLGNGYEQQLRFRAPAVPAAFVPHNAAPPDVRPVWAEELMAGHSPLALEQTIPAVLRREVYNRALGKSGLPGYAVRLDDVTQNTLIDQTSPDCIIVSKIDVMANAICNYLF